MMSNLNKTIRIYIASPYTIGDKEKNAKRQIDISGILIEYNYAPFIPLLSHYAEEHLNIGEEKWFNWDLKWLECCDILIRMKVYDDNGEEVYSKGADIEVERALELKIPVYEFDSLEKIKEWCEFSDIIKL